MKRNFIYLFAISSSLLTVTACNDKPDEAQAQAQQQAAAPASLEVLQLSRQDATTNQEFSTKLEGQQNVEIRPKINGFIKQVLVDEGEQVRKGQLLFKLETETLSQDAGAAKANVAAARVEVDRLKPLVAKGIIGKVQLDAAQARLSQAQSSYNSVATNINFANVTSPVDGVIGSIPYKVGTLVSSAIVEPLTTVSDAKVVRAYFNMNERQMLEFSKNTPGATMAEKMKNTQQVSLKLIDNTIYDQKGKLSAINGLIDPTTGTTKFRADFNNPNGILRSGNSGMILIPTTHKDAVLVPQFAVVDVQGKKQVFVVKEGNKVEAQFIEIVAEIDNQYVVSGLEGTETIVVEGVSKLQNGAVIAPKNSAAKPAAAPAVQQ